MIDLQAPDGDLWTRWAPTIGAAARWDPPRTPTLVVAPHPAEEILASGGLIGRQRCRRITVRVLAVTDGECASEPGSNLDLAAVHRYEQSKALQVLGLDDDAICRAGLPDGRVALHERELVERIISIGGDCGLIVAPWAKDHHRDHEACGRAATAAASILGISLAYSLFWTWHRGSPARLAGRPVVGMVLRYSEARRREHALSQHRSQLTDTGSMAPLSYTTIEPTRWPVEYYVIGRR